jgi:hypothetical protein
MTAAPIVVVLGVSLIGSLPSLAHVLRIARHLSVVFRRMMSHWQDQDTSMTGRPTIEQ